MKVFLISGFLISVAYAYRYGAPLEACSKMFPSDHDVDARMDGPPFTITVSKNTYTGGDSIDVTIDAADTDPDNSSLPWYFEGILIMARKAKTANVDCPTTPIGTWEVPVNDDFVHVIDCYPKVYDKSAITHYSHVRCYNKTVTWKAPAAPVGHIYFVATIARNKERFWVNVQSEPVMDPTDSATVTQTCAPLQTKYEETTTTCAGSYYHLSLLLNLLIFIGLTSL